MSAICNVIALTSPASVLIMTLMPWLEMALPLAVLCLAPLQLLRGLDGTVLREARGRHHFCPDESTMRSIVRASPAFFSGLPGPGVALRRKAEVLRPRVDVADNFTSPGRRSSKSSAPVLPGTCSADVDYLDRTKL